MEEVEGASPASPPPLSSTIASPPHNPSLSDGNEEVIGENGEDHEQEIISSGDGALSDELCAKIVRQVEYYFSDANLPADKFLLKYTKKNGRGFVPIGVIASFRKMKRLVKDHSLIEAALRTSSNLVVSEDGKKVKRINPLPATAETKADRVIAETKADKLRTVMVENLPENYSEESIRQTFGEVGEIVKISIQDPQSAEGSHGKKEVYLIRNKVHAHALVEYNSIAAAEKAVATLNDEKDWRSGLRVKHLAKKTGSHMFDNFITKNKEAEGGEVGSEKDDKEEEHAKGRRHNNRTRRKGHVQKSAIEQGHGCGTVGSTSGVTNKPLPGPRMPDGTRGFTMGRGKPVRSDYKPDLQDP
ncbi:la-related protein 6A [Carex littledalei]|uniref:La-related protein 6A n=1 Tax=Carex littledalei TaxID=544730 RepID=A0A833RHZ8_9POAL|nr:la-related protein 6A [Carex littledalei]